MAAITPDREGGAPGMTSGFWRLGDRPVTGRISQRVTRAAGLTRDTVTPVSSTSLVQGSRASRSTIALKLLMAVSGLVFIGYLILHMYGNLKVFAGHEAFNEYAHHLRTFGEPMLPYSGLLWIVRVTLIVAIVAHLYSAYALAARAG